MRRLAFLVVALAGLAGCATGPSGPPPGPGGPGGPGAGPRPGLFVSPFGELFLSEPGAPWPVAAWFSGADTDSDGRMTFEEFTADGLRQFGALDQNGDGRLTPEEIALYEQSLAAARARMPGLEGGRRPPGQRMGGPGGAMALGLAGAPQQGDGPRRARNRAPTGPLAYGAIAAAGFFNYPQPVKAADADTNQTVTGEEWSRATDRWFIALDTDQDGVLTLETLPRTPLQQMAER